MFINLSKKLSARAPHKNIKIETFSLQLTELHRRNLPRLPSRFKVKVTLRLTVSQSVSLGIEPHLRPTTRYLFLSDSYVLVSVGRPL
jgi:hypothetical protein